MGGDGLETFILFALSIPIFFLLLFGYTDPEEALMLGNRWEYAEEPVFSEERLKLTKYSSLFFLVLLCIWYASILFKIIKGFISLFI